MKSRVEYDTATWIITLILCLVFIGSLCLTYREPVGFIAIAAIAVPTCFISLFFAPISITADENKILIRAPFKTRSISMSEIVRVERYTPWRNTIRICASGGFMGYWGTFRDSRIGRYTGYWGNNKQCFLLTLTNGRKYLLGCKDPDAMTAYIAAHMSA
ncbi:MAG: PH domain-containing protein [Muribaculaceae bacterium]|nr:PH domain-containing protein [Muribaculaceae bacterium]